MLIRKLLIVFASALMLAILALSAAWVIGGDAARKMIHDGRGWSIDLGDDEGEDHGPQGSRDFAWTGAQPLVIDVPADFDYRPAPAYRMTITGPTASLAQISVENGRITTRGHMGHGVRIRAEGPQISALTLSAPGRYRLKGLAQRDLRIDAEGAAELVADGTVNALVIHSTGVGSIDLSELKARDAKLTLDGVGNVDINATGQVDLDLSGIGNVTLHAKPQQLRSRTDGIGAINRDY